LRVILAQLENIWVSLEKESHIDLPNHNRLLESVPVETSLDSLSSLLLFGKGGLGGLEGQMVHLHIARVQLSDLRVALENDAVNLSALLFASLSKVVVQLTGQ